MGDGLECSAIIWVVAIDETRSKLDWGRVVLIDGLLLCLQGLFDNAYGLLILLSPRVEKTSDDEDQIT